MLMSYISAEEIVEPSVKSIASSLGYESSLLRKTKNSENPPEMPIFQGKKEFLLNKKKGSPRVANKQIEYAISNFYEKIGFNVIQEKEDMDFVISNGIGTYAIYASNFPEQNEILMTIRYTDKIKRE